MADGLYDWHSRWSENDQRAYYDVFWIMQHYLKIEWIDLRTKVLSQYPEKTISALKEAIDAYQKGKPLAYLLGNVDFYDLNFQIREGVLIPRPDTEPMVSEVIKRLRGGERILELGTGSGAIACAIAHHMPKVEIIAVERSDIACEVAQQNINLLHLGDRIKLVKESWYNLSLSGFDWVISNPPYIAKNDPNMSESVYQFEPLEALESEDSGYKDLLHIIHHAKKWLVPGGSLALEHGFLQQDVLDQSFKSCDYQDIYRGRDTKHPRFIIGKRPK